MTNRTMVVIGVVIAVILIAAFWLGGSDVNDAMGPTSTVGEPAGTAPPPATGDATGTGSTPATEPETPPAGAPAD